MSSLESLYGAVAGLGSSSGVGGAGARARRPQEDDFWDARREQRERIGRLGVSAVWGASPTRPE